MAKMFSSYFMQAEFQYLYRVLLPSLNQCGACGVTKCFFCAKFDICCASYNIRRCIACVKFHNTLNFFLKNSTKDQCNYIFLHDIFRLHSKTREHFKDVSTPIRPSVRNTCFIISNDSKIDNRIMNDRKKNSMYYIVGHRKCKFYFNVV